MKSRIHTYLSLTCISLLFFMLYFGWLKLPRNYGYLLNSDFLHIVFFSESLFRGLSNLPHWYTTPAPYLFPDMGLFGLIGQVVSRETGYLTVLFLDFLFLNIALYRLHRIFFPDNPSFRLTALVLFNGVMLGLLAVSRVDFMIYLNQFAPVNHLGAFICIGLFLRTKLPSGYAYPLWLSGIWLISLSDPVFLLYFLPVQLLLTYKKNTAISHLLIVAVCVSAFILYKFLYAKGILKTTSPESPGFRFTEEALMALPRIIVRLWESPSFWVLAGLWLLSFAALFLPVRHKPALFYFIFCVPWLVNFLGFFMSEDTLRYVSGSLFFGIFMGISVLLYPLYGYLEHKTFGFPALLPLSAGILFLFTFRWQQNHFDLYTPGHICEIEKFVRKHHADYVLTDYWNARPVLFFTQGIRAVPMTRELFYNFHENDRRLYDSIIAIQNPVIALYSSGLDPDSVAKFRNRAFPVTSCFQDSLMLLERNPLPGH